MRYGKNPLYVHDSLFAIGDVHGEKDKLENLLGKLRPELKPGDCLVFCGDLVDVGPDSPGVLKLIRDFKKEFPNTYVVRGNHEEMMLSYAFNQPCDYSWIHNKGKSTIEQFLVDWTIPEGKADFREALEKADLVEFVQSFIPYFESETVIVTHAPFDRGIVGICGGLVDETAEHLLDKMGGAIRWRFTDDKLRIPEIKKFRICGHQFDHSRKPRIFKECVFLDTGCGYKANADLAAIQFPGKKIIYSDPPKEVSL